MSLRIRLDRDKKHVYYPGERVSGEVVLQCVKDEDISVVGVTFAGMIDAA